MLPVLETDHLILRPWCEDDASAFAAMNADERVMEFFPSVLSRDESLVMMNVANARIESDGISFAPIEEKATGRFLGFVGLNRPRYDPPLPFEPCVEIGWRLIVDAWGKGYASEAARAWLGFGFETLGLSEIVSFTAAINLRSQAVMQRIGMVHDRNGDFDHPVLAPGHPLERHVLYRMRRS